MEFLKSLFGGGKTTAPLAETSPTQEEFDEAEARLKRAVEESPHEATSDIANMASALYELYSKRSDFLIAQGDRDGLIFNAALGLAVYTMAAQAHYHIGFTKKGIEALREGLRYAHEALSAAPNSPHAVAVNDAQREMKRLLTTFEAVQRAGEEDSAQICTAIRDAGVRFANIDDPIRRIRGLKQYLLAPKIAQSFDKLCGADLIVLDKYASRCFCTTYVGINKAKGEGEEWRETCGWLLMNALSTLVAAIDLMRDGFILQPGVLIRNLLEILTAILCVVVDKEHWKAFQADKLRPEAELSTANRVLPIFGKIYGFFSGQFAHVRQFYARIHPIIEYKSRDYEPLAANVSFARMAMWLIYVVTELVFNQVLEPIYWKSLGHGAYEYTRTEEGRALEYELFGKEIDEEAEE